MAISDVPTDSKVIATEAEPWDEARIRASLSRIEWLQLQIDNLRSTLPHIRKPLSEPTHTKAAYFSNFQKATLGSVQELESFKTNWFAESTQEILEKAKQRIKTDPDLTKCRTVAKHGWTKDNQNNFGGVTAEDENADMRKQLLERWKTAHEGNGTAIGEEGQKILIDVNSGPFKLHFVVDKSTDTDTGSRLNVKCSSDRLIRSDIEACIAARPQPESLEQTLDMIAAYKDLSSASCTVCGRLPDRHGNIPTARRMRKAGEKDASKETDWTAIHKDCLPEPERHSIIQLLKSMSLHSSI